METVHEWIKSFKLGETKRKPSNATSHNLRYYARSRFGFDLVLEDDDYMRRADICSNCGIDKSCMSEVQKELRFLKSAVKSVNRIAEELEKKIIEVEGLK